MLGWGRSNCRKLQSTFVLLELSNQMLICVLLTGVGVDRFRNATEDLREADSTDDEVNQINSRAEIKRELEKINAIKQNGRTAPHASRASPRLRKESLNIE